MRERVLIVLAALLMAGCTRRGVEPGSLHAHCALTSKTDTGERVYCGKACFKPVYRYTYACPPVVTFTGD